MTLSYQQCSPVSVFLAQQSQNKEWVKESYNPAAGLSKSKLLFNEAVPASASNRASRVGPPAPVVIERLLPVSEKPEKMDSARSSFTFTALSEERLQAAVKLAKRDVQLRRLECSARPSVRHSQEAPLCEATAVEPCQDLAVKPEKTQSKAPSNKGTVMRPSTKHCTFNKHPTSTLPRVGLSPPTRDSGPWQAGGSKEGALSHEISRLRCELEAYVNKVEALAKEGDELEQPLEAEEQARLDIHRKKQATHSARIIYVLRQQVKEVQEEIEKIQSQKSSDTKKTVALNRLAAVHRRALSVLQVFNKQLSDASRSEVSPHCKELGQLIRRLCLCSAKVEQGSAVPEMTLDILQRLETLDCALGKREQLERRQAPACPPLRRSPHRSMSPPAAPKGPTATRLRGPGRPAHPRGRVHGRKTASQMLQGAPGQPVSRRDVLSAAVESLAQQWELREQLKPPKKHRGKEKKGLHSDMMKHVETRDAGFQQPTVSSRLRVNQLPQKESSVPWKPTSPHSPHSPPPRRSPPRERPEPRCLFSPVKPSPSSPKQRGGCGLGAEPALNWERKKEAQNQALREAWLDGMTTQRLKELNRLGKEEEERIKRLRSDVVSPTQWAERAEREARERIQPLLDEAQAAGSAERLSEGLLEDLLDDATRVAWAAETDRQLEDTARWRLQAPTLESMLLRMEEIQKDQDDVRRRFASITYSDPLPWERPGAAGSLSCAPGSRPASPQPIRLTRPVLKQTSTADVVLEAPVETGFQFENSLSEEAPQDERQPGNHAAAPAPTRGNTVLSVPQSMLGNIRQYRQDYDSFLCAAAHKGSFTPWTVAESVADELLWEAVADVAAEFQDVVEQYAEAVFTSEFLQPIPSPPASAAVSQ